MRAEIKGCLSFLGACIFALWGAFLNAALTPWFWRTQGYDWHKMMPYVPINPMFLGLILGFVTPFPFIYRNVRMMPCGVAFFLLVTGFFLLDLHAGKSWLLCFDDYALSFLWALSLIVSGYILRSRPKDATM